MAKEKDNLKGMEIKELKEKLAGLYENLRILHFKVEGSKSKNVKEASSLKKQIAKILTEINKQK